MTRRLKWLLLTLSVTGVHAGCARYRGEQCCPIDARAIYCAPGEEAVRSCPCGPDAMFYGHKATSWRAWPQGWFCYQTDHVPQGDLEVFAQELPEEIPQTIPEGVDAGDMSLPTPAETQRQTEAEAMGADSAAWTYPAAPPTVGSKRSAQLSKTVHRGDSPYKTGREHLNSLKFLYQPL